MSVVDSTILLSETQTKSIYLCLVLCGAWRLQLPFIAKSAPVGKLKVKIIDLLKRRLCPTRSPMKIMLGSILILYFDIKHGFRQIFDDRNTKRLVHQNANFDNIKIADWSHLQQLQHLVAVGINTPKTFDLI